MPGIEKEDKDNFKLFSLIVKDNKTCPTAAERLVQEAPYVTKEGNPFNTALTVVDRALYKPKASTAEEALKRIENSSSQTSTVEHNKTYTKYEFINTTINKVEDFFDDVRYDVNLGNASITKDLSPDKSISANVDFIGNVGLGFSKRYNQVQFDTAVQYKPAQHEGRVNLNFTDGIHSGSTSIYLNNYNPGAMTNYTKHLENNKSIGAGLSVFKEDTNMYVKYKQNNISIAAFGAVRKPLVGISARATF